MDSTLINLIPNLMTAYNTRKHLPHDPPPPYTRHANANAREVPLTIELCSGPKPSQDPAMCVVERSFKEKISLRSGFMGYVDMVLDVRQNLIDRGVSKASGSWWVGITAEVKGKGGLFLPWRKEVDIFDEKRWEDIRSYLEEGRVRGLRVMCWRD